MINEYYEKTCYINIQNFVLNALGQCTLDDNYYLFVTLTYTPRCMYATQSIAIRLLYIL